ncbi:MAG: signal peptidase I [Clostridia bacterium]|nr:signal peptidase I [Clostridia bacterium]
MIDNDINMTDNDSDMIVNDIDGSFDGTCGSDGLTEEAENSAETVYYEVVEEEYVEAIYTDENGDAAPYDTETEEDPGTAAAENTEVTEEEEEESIFKRLRYAEKPSFLYYLREVISYTIIFIIAVVAGLFINIYIFRLSRVNGTSMYPTLQDTQLVTASRLPVIFNTLKHGDVVIFDHSGEARTFMKDLSQAINDNALTALFKKSQSEIQHTYYIKRVIGLEGDVIRVYEGKIYRTTLANIGKEEYLTLYKAYNESLAQAGVYNSPEDVLENQKASQRLTEYLKTIAEIKPDETWELLDEPYVNSEETAKYASIEGRVWVCGEHEMFVMGDNRNHSTDSRVIGVKNIDCVIGKVIGNY